MTSRRTRSPRDRRSRDRASRHVEKLERKIPYYDLFAEGGLDLIEEHADRILAEVGIEVWGDDTALDLFREAGATLSLIHI